jgi:hypothetical protein
LAANRDVSYGVSVMYANLVFYTCFVIKMPAGRIARIASAAAAAAAGN